MLSRALSKSSPWPSIKSNPASTEKSLEYSRQTSQLSINDSESQLTHRGASGPVLVSVARTHKQYRANSRQVVLMSRVQQQCSNCSVAKRKIMTDDRSTRQPSEHCPCHWSNNNVEVRWRCVHLCIGISQYHAENNNDSIRYSGRENDATSRQFT